MAAAHCGFKAAGRACDSFRTDDGRQLIKPRCNCPRGLGAGESDAACRILRDPSIRIVPSCRIITVACRKEALRSFLV
jgi:hypothetical protein